MFVKTLAALALSAVLSAAAAGAAIAVAALTHTLALVVVASVVVVAAGSVLIGRILRRRDRFGTAVGVAILAAAISLTWVIPAPARLPPDPVAGAVTITVGNGDRLRVLEIPGATHARPPIIFVHGGPGVSDMIHDAPALAGLATDRDVYVYDQVGAGGSSRLHDPTAYTLHRSLSDLDAVRALTGADRVVLIGHSWGARIVAAYLAEHADAVAAAVLTAPGPPPASTRPLPAPDPATRLAAADRIALYADALQPRRLFGYLMAGAAPDVAHQLAGDAEMDASFAGLYAHELPAMFCDPSRSGSAGTSGVGFYSYLLGQAPAEGGPTVARLSEVEVPILVIKPTCDYVPDAIAREYLTLFPNARMVHVPGGHLAYLENGSEWMRVVEGFLS